MLFRSALAAGFKLKGQRDGSEDLNPYVYAFAQSLISTPASRWREAGFPEPHPDLIGKERARLPMGNLTDDELANAVFMYGDTPPSIADLMSGKGKMPIAYLTAGKERIRWLSRQLEDSLDREKQLQAQASEHVAQIEALRREFQDARRTLQVIASCGADSTDAEIVDVVLGESRRWVSRYDDSVLKSPTVPEVKQ